MNRQQKLGDIWDMPSNRFKGTTKPEPYVEPPHGVYFLFEGKKLAYVGRSRDPEKRLAAHRSNGRPFDTAIVAHCKGADVGWIEKALIEALAPYQNRAGKPMFEPPLSMPAPPPKVIHQVVYRDKIVEASTPKPDPEELRTVAGWQPQTFLRNARGAFADAVRDGQIPSFWANPAVTGKGARRLVRRQDVEEWVNARLAQSRAA